MLVWSQSTTRRAIIAFAVLLALVASNVGIAASHQPIEEAIAETMIHGSSAPQVEHGHDHDHDVDDEGGAKLFGHTHGHNAADHSHVAVGAPPAVLSIAYVIEDSWMAAPSQSASIKAHFRLDRPPKTAFFA